MSKSECVVEVGTNTADTVNREKDDPDIPSPRNPSNSEIILHLDQYLSHLSQDQQHDVHNLLFQHQEVISDVPGQCSVMEHDITLINPRPSPVRQSAYRLSPSQKDAMRAEVDYLLQNRLAQPSKSPWASPCLLVPKPDGSKRFCTDFRKVNAVTVQDSYPLPLIEDLIDTVGNSKLVTTIDLQKGYYQIALTPQAREISVFITPFGLYEYLVMPFGLVNAPATFRRIMNFVVQELPGVYAYLDDIVIVANSWEEHLMRLRLLFQKLHEVGLTINLAKTKFCTGTVNYLGHVVGQGQAKPKKANVEAILNYPTPANRKDLMRFLGMAGFYRRFCVNFAEVSAPLTDLTSVKRKFTWTAQCTRAFNCLKELLASNPVLATPDHSRPFSLQIDASSRGVGSVLLQQNENTGVWHPISYFSYKLKDHQRSYSVVELETLALVLSLERFKCYLSNNFPVTVYTDHNPLTFLRQMKNHNQRLVRWALSLQEYPLLIKHIRGKDNLIADALSRSPVE